MILEQVKEAAYRTILKWPGDTDGEKASRAIEAYELGYLPLLKVYKRRDALKVLDCNGRQMFNVSERHVRRIETIRQKKPADAARLERIAILGALSLELVEWFVNHPPSADTMEAIWLIASNESRQEFMVRVKQ